MKRTWLFGLLIIYSVSCSDDVKPSAVTYSQVFTGMDHKSWSLKSLIFRQQGKGDQSYYLDPCILDDEYIFYANADRTYIVNGGTQKCSANEPSVLVNDTWSFVNATATLTIWIPSFFESAVPFIIRTANDKQLVLDLFTNQDGTSYYEIAFSPNKN